jgi:uncharacterized protein
MRRAERGARPGWPDRMSELVARLRGELTEARKAHDKPRTLLLGTILSDVMNRALELGREVTDEEAGEVLRRGARKRREAAGIFGRAGRTDLESRESAEAAALEQFLPAALGDDAIRAAVRGAVRSGASSIGAIMGRVMPQLKGLADGARVGAIAREELEHPS